MKARERWNPVIIYLLDYQWKHLAKRSVFEDKSLNQIVRDLVDADIGLSACLTQEEITGLLEEQREPTLEEWKEA